MQEVGLQTSYFMHWSENCIIARALPRSILDGWKPCHRGGRALAKLVVGVENQGLRLTFKWRRNFRRFRGGWSFHRKHDNKASFQQLGSRVPKKTEKRSRLRLVIFRLLPQPTSAAPSPNQCAVFHQGLRPHGMPYCRRLRATLPRSTLWPFRPTGSCWRRD